MTAHVTIVTDGEVVDLGWIDTQEILDVARDRYALNGNGDPQCIDDGTKLIVDTSTGTIQSTTLDIVVTADNPDQFESYVLALSTNVEWPRPDRIILML